MLKRKRGLGPTDQLYPTKQSRPVKMKGTASSEFSQTSGCANIDALPNNRLSLLVSLSVAAGWGGVGGSPAFARPSQSASVPVQRLHPGVNRRKSAWMVKPTTGVKTPQASSRGGLIEKTYHSQQRGRNHTNEYSDQLLLARGGNCTQSAWTFTRSRRVFTSRVRCSCLVLSHPHLPSQCPVQTPNT
jgi:hypothetical protein